MKTYSNPDGGFLTESEVITRGFVQLPDFNEGFLVLPGATSEYVEQVGAFRARWSAVDGCKGSNKFGTLDAALEYKRQEWPTGVSDDGVQRFDGIQYQILGSKTWFNRTSKAMGRNRNNLPGLLKSHS